MWFALDKSRETTKNKNTLWPVLMDGVRLSQRLRVTTTEESLLLTTKYYFSLLTLKTIYF